MAWAIRSQVAQSARQEGIGPISEEGVDERGDGRALGEQQQRAEYDQDQHHRNHPPEFSFPEERDELPHDVDLPLELLHPLHESSPTGNREGKVFQRADASTPPREMS